MRFIVGITSALVIAVFSVAYLYFSSLTVDSRSNDKTLALIPSNASIVFRFSNEQSLYDIFKDYPVFDQIIGTHKKTQLTWLNKFITTNSELSAIANGQHVFLSFHPDPKDSVAFLFLMPVSEVKTTTEAEIILTNNQYNLSKTNIGGTDILEIKGANVPGTLYVHLNDGIAKGSFSKELLEQSISSDVKKITPGFVQQINTAMADESDAIANVYINHNEPGFLKAFFKQNPSGNLGLFGSFNAYSNLSLNYKSDALMFNGVTNNLPGHKGYLSLFLDQQPVQNTIKRILPYNTANSICYGFSDYNTFHSGLKNLFSLRKELDALNQQLQLIITETGVNPDRDIKKLLGKEFSNIQLSTYENLAVLRVTNGTQLNFFLEPLSLFYSDAVRKMNYGDLFYYYFGDPLKKFNAPYYAITDNLIIISNSPVTVQHFLNDYNSNRLLINNEAFTRFDQLVADQSNISFLMHLSNSKSLLGSVLKGSYSDILQSKKYGFSDFYAISYQLTSNKDHFFTNFYLGLKTAVTEDTQSIVYDTDSNVVN